MGECWPPPDALRRARMDTMLMEERQVRALAGYFRTFHGADSFVGALEQARALSGAETLANALVWSQIAEEISQMETSDILERCLKRQE